MQTLCQDVRYGLRMLAKAPGFTAVAVLTLALGIGANTGIFTIINSVLLSALPVKNPQQLVFLSDPNSQGMSDGSEDGDRDLLTWDEFEEFRDHNQVFTGVLAADSQPTRPNVSVDDGGNSSEGQPAYVTMVSGDYFSVLGVSALMGRTFTGDMDGLRDANPVAVISYNFWQSRFGGEADILGRKLRIFHTAFDVIGVAPKNFTGETVGFSPDVWTPLSMQAEVMPGRDLLTPLKDPREKLMWLQVVGRLKPGVSVEQAKASVNVEFQQYLQSQIGTTLTEQDRKNFLNQHIALAEGSRGASTLRGNFEQPLLILMGVVGLVLLIACANVANLLLARAASRQKEIAVRVALGAGRGRLFRQLLTESILLALLGGGFGLLFAQWADVGLLRLVSRGPQPIPLDIHPDVKILGFTLGVALLTGILFGLVPAFRTSRVDLNGVLKGTSRGFSGGGGRGGRVSAGKILVVAQVALSLLLLIVAGLFVHSFQKLAEVKLGYDRDHLLLFRVNPLQAGYKGPGVAQLFKDLVARIQGIPGVRGVTLSQNGLFSGSESADQITIEGYTPKSGQEMHARFDLVGPNYFSTVGIPILLGREIGPQDEGNGQRVGVINQTMAKYYFGKESPIGRRIWDMYPTTHTDFIVVGVVADAKYNSVRETTPRRFYVPFFHPIGDANFGNIEVRAAGEPAAVIAGVRDAVKQTAPNLQIPQFQTMNQLVEGSLTRDNMITTLASFFGGLAVLLACIGIYGIMGYAVAGRTNEIGIRMALGAQPGNVLLLVLRESLILVLIGVGIGLPAVIGAGKLISSLLYGLTPADPLTLAIATVLMIGVASVASYIPARRAARTNPIVALRYE
jgi:predicted permease